MILHSLRVLQIRTAIFPELDSSLAVGISGNGEAYGYPISIVDADGQTHTGKINKGTTWANAKIEGVEIKSGTYISTTAPNADTGKPSSTPENMEDANTAITVPTAEGPYYNYAKVTVTKDGKPSGEEYYQVGTSTDKILPAEDAGIGHYWKVEGNGVISDDKIVGSGTVTVTKTPCEYKLSIDGTEVDGVTVTFGAAWSDEYSSATVSENKGYILSSDVTGNGPFTDEQLIGNGQYATVSVPAVDETIKLETVNKITGYSYNGTDYIKTGWYRPTDTITLPDDVINLDGNQVITGWKVGDKPYELGATVNVSEIVANGGKIEPVIETAYTIKLPDGTTKYVYAGADWSDFLTFDGNTKYYFGENEISSSSKVGEGFALNSNGENQIDIEFKVTYSAGNSNLIIPYEKIGDFDTTEIGSFNSTHEIWVAYGTAIDKIEAPIVQYPANSRNQFSSWNYGVTQITSPLLNVTPNVPTTIESGVDLANPDHLYITDDDVKYDFVMVSNYVASGEYTSKAPAGYQTLNSSIAQAMIGFSQDNKDAFAGWTFYWDTRLRQNSSGSKYSTTTVSWVSGGINGKNAIQVYHYLYDGDEMIQRYDDVVAFIKKYGRFPGKGDMFKNNALAGKDPVVIEAFDATGANVTGIYYRILSN